MPDQIDFNEVYISNIQVPPTTTMPMHYADVNPHPQYLRVDATADFITSNIAMSDLKDVNIIGAQPNDTILVFNGGTYSPITLTSLGRTLSIPYATSLAAGVIRVAMSIYETDTVAVTPTMVKDYVGDQVEQLTSTINQVNTSFTQLPYATTINSGVVLFATNQETVTGTETSKAVTPAGVKAAIANIPIATTNVPGLVKTVETDNSLGKQFIADLITSNRINDHLITSYVPQIQYNQFVNIRVADWLVDNANEIYYVTSVGPVGWDEEAEVLAYPRNYKVGYIVYSNGVLSGRNKVATADYTNVYIAVSENGAAYDINTHGDFVVAQEGIAKRLTVGKTCYATIMGEAHNVLISTNEPGGYLPTGGTGGLLEIRSHGHVTYCTITGYGNVNVAPMYDTVAGDGTGAYDDAIIENVIVSDIGRENDNYAGLYVSPKGKAFNVVLTGSYAGATIAGYAKDVVVHSGCCLWTNPYTTKIDNLILYNGAEIKMEPGVKITGCIAYPGAIINSATSCSVTFNTCREPDHVVTPLYSTCTYYTKKFETVELGDGTTSQKIVIENNGGRWYFVDSRHWVTWYTSGVNIDTSAGPQTSYVIVNPNQATSSEITPYRTGLESHVALLHGTSTLLQTITTNYTSQVEDTTTGELVTVPLTSAVVTPSEEGNYLDFKTTVYATTTPKYFVRSDTRKLSDMNQIAFLNGDDITSYNNLSSGAIQCYPATLLTIGDPDFAGTIKYEIVPDFGPDAYCEQVVARPGTNEYGVGKIFNVTSVTSVNGETATYRNIEIGKYGVFDATSAAKPYHVQIHSKMYEELATPDTSIVWKVTF